MPDSVLGLFLFLVGLGPGYLYVRFTERYRPRAERSEVMEVAELVLVGAACSALVSVILLPIMNATKWVSVSSLVTGPAAYVAEHPWNALTALLVVLTASYGVAYGAFRIRYRNRSEVFDPDSSVWVREITRMTKEGAEGISATVELEDGRVIKGFLSSYTPDIDGDANRDIALAAPISVKMPGASDEEIPDIERLILAAEQIRYLSLATYKES